MQSVSGSALAIAHGLQGFQIEDGHLGERAVADEAAVEFRRESDAMLALESGDVADERARIGVHHLDGGAARQVDAAGGGIDRDVIEIFRGAAGRGAEHVGFQKMVAAIGTREGQTCQRRAEPQKIARARGADSFMETSLNLRQGRTDS